MTDEKVLVVPKTTVFPDVAQQGFIADDTHTYLDRMRTDYRFEPRRLVEDDPTLKQLIPYVVFMHAGTVFLVRRSTSQSEQRLVGLHSIGIGGHINSSDTASDSATYEQRIDAFSRMLSEGLHREIHEEVWLSETPDLRFVGLINDDSNSVGRVHLGLVYVAHLSLPSVSVRERDMMAGCFVDVRDLGTYYPTMETWSQIVVDSGCLAGSGD
jgi:predicted NUDIX family phosphoesterase